jgi:MID domain of pPIWI_RE
MAREFYPNPQDSDKQLHDDLVNKPSTRKALAVIGRSCVQFILPSKIWLKSGDLKISDFIIRAQAATKDLIWAHSGRNEWTKLAAPLFFERVVRDYISAFTLEEDEETEEK